MSTKSKSALAERIRGVLARVDSPQSPDVVAVLAEAAILLEVQCEESKLLFDLIPIVVERLIPQRQVSIDPFAGGSPFAGGTPGTPDDPCKY